MEIDIKNRQRIEDSFTKEEKGLDSHYDSRNKTNKVYLLENNPDVKERRRSPIHYNNNKRKYEYYFD